MREPEFVPDWYRRRLRRGRRLRALANATAAVTAVAAAWLTFFSVRAPAVGAPDVRVSSPAAQVAARNNLPAGAEATLRGLHRLTPHGVVVSAVTFRDDGGATAVELQCLAADASIAERFIAGVRGAAAFRDVTVTSRPRSAGHPDEVGAPVQSDRAAVILQITFEVVAGGGAQ